MTDEWEKTPLLYRFFGKKKFRRVARTVHCDPSEFGTDAYSYPVYVYANETKEVATGRTDVEKRISTQTITVRSDGHTTFDPPIVVPAGKKVSIDIRTGEVSISEDLADSKWFAENVGFD